VTAGFAEINRVVVHALIIAVVIRTFLFQPFNIPSGSMIPTLLVGDYLFVSKYSYGYTHYSLPLSPELFSGRFPVAGCRSAAMSSCSACRKDDSIDYIKRAVGLPGDKIQVLHGVLSINACRSSANAVTQGCVAHEDIAQPSCAFARRCRTA